MKILRQALIWNSYRPILRAYTCLRVCVHARVCMYTVQVCAIAFYPVNNWKRRLTVDIFSR